MTACVVLLNARAAGVEGGPVDRAVDVLRRHREVEVVHTASVGDIDRALDRLDGRRLVVAGGDGSVHVVVQRLHDRGRLAATPVGLVPLGTGNDLARGLGLPLDAADAATVAATGEPRPLDLLVDDRGQVVVNAVHAGVGAEAAERSQPMKDGLGALAYPIGAVLAGLRRSGWELEVTVDEQPVRVGGGPHLLMVGIANGPTIGGGTPLCPSASPHDGRLDVVVVGAAGPAARTAFAAALRAGQHLRRDDVVHRQGRQVRVVGEPVPYNADGEVSDPVGDRTYRVRASAWRVVVPAGRGG